MKIVKVLGVALLVLVAFIALSIYMTANNLNEIVKQAVEQVGSETLKTEVSLANVDVSLTESRARLSGLTIQNVSGFEKANIFQMDDVVVDLNLEALLEQRIDLMEVTITGLQVVAEQKGVTTNIQQLLDQLPKAKGSTDSSQNGESTSAASDLLIKVRSFEFAKSGLTLVTEKWGDQVLDIPVITLTNLGGEQGVPPDQLAVAIFEPLLQQVNSAVEGKMKSIVEDKAKEKLEEKEDELKDKYRSKLKEKLGDDAEDVEGALKSLFSR